VLTWVTTNVNTLLTARLVHMLTTDSMLTYKQISLQLAQLVLPNGTAAVFAIFGEINAADVYLRMFFRYLIIKSLAFHVQTI